MKEMDEEFKIEKLKQTVGSIVDSRRKELIEMSLEIHRNPEPPFEEVKASRLLATYLEKNGFVIEYGAYGLRTAFRATIGSSKPRIGIMAEYDAVNIPEYAHACGHNIIGTAAIGAGVALASVINEVGGSIVVFGTPAEELNEKHALGKELMAQQSAFNDIDAAMMIHPWNRDLSPWDCGGLVIVEVEYFGKSSHPVVPEQAINAHDAMLTGFAAYAALRQNIIGASWGPTQYSSGYITKAGVGAHQIPGHTAAQLAALAWTDSGLKDLLSRLHNCFKAGEIATGARLEFNYDFDNRYRTLRSNKVISKIFDANLRAIRPNWNPVAPVNIWDGAATDMGSVSQITPSIHPGIAITASSTTWHSSESAAAAASEDGHRGMLDGAKAMAMTTIDLIRKPDILKKAREEFEETWKEC